MKLGQIVATNEDLSADGALGATEAALEAEKTATDVAEGNVEVVEGAKCIDGVDTGIEDAFEAQDRVEDLLEAAQDTMQQGGMTEAQAKLLEITHESIMASIGLSHRNGSMKNPVASLESFRHSETRASKTLLTVEGLMDSAKDIGSKIIAALKALLSTAMGFIANLLKNRALLAKHLDNLEKRLKALPNDIKLKNAEISGGAAAISIDGKASVDTAKKIAASATAMCGTIAGIVAAVKTTSNAEEAITQVKAAVRSMQKNGEGHGFLTAGRSVVIKHEGDTFELSIKEGKTAEKAEAPSRAEMLNLVVAAKTTVQALRDIEKVQTPFKDSINNLITRLGEVVNVVRSKVGSEETKAKQAEAAAVKKNARVARAILSKAGGPLPGAVFAAAKGIADYVVAGLSNIEAEKQAAK